MQPFDKRGDLDSLKGIVQSNKHRRVQSNTGTSAVSQLFSKNGNASLGYSSNQGQRYGSTSKTGAYEDFTTPNQKMGADSVPGSSGLKQLTLGDIELYSAKRLKSIMSLQSSLQTNLSRFTDMIEKCRKENSKRNSNRVATEILKTIQELSSFPGISQRRTSDLIRNLEELYYDYQNRMDAELSNKDTNFLFVTNEAKAFADITMKICTEFGCQSNSLKKKLNSFFDSQPSNPRDPAEVFKISKTEQKKPHATNTYSRYSLAKKPLQREPKFGLARLRPRARLR
jgi:hypothetical protein